MLRALIEKLDNMQLQIDNVNREMQFSKENVWYQKQCNK